MNGPHCVHHVNAKARRIAGSQYKFDIKNASSRFATPSGLLGYLERFMRRVCIVHSVVLPTDWIRPLTVERARQGFYY